MLLVTQSNFVQNVGGHVCDFKWVTARPPKDCSHYKLFYVFASGTPNKIEKYHYCWFI